mgnify:CR=1 FL=1
MRMTKQLPFILSGLLFLFTACSSQQEKRADFHVVPLPQQIDSTGNGAFWLSEKTLIAYPENDEELKRNAALLADFVAQKTGMQLQVKADESSQSVIALSKGLSGDNPEAYSLTVSSQRIDIQGAAGSGVFYGIQTLRKALPICDGNATVSVPLVSGALISMFLVISLRWILSNAILICWLYTTLMCSTGISPMIRDGVLKSSLVLSLLR